MSDDEEELPPMTNQFSRLEESDLTPETAMHLFQKNGFLWVRLNEKDRHNCHSIWSDNDTAKDNNSKDEKVGSALSPLRRIYKERPDCIKRRWAVENRGDYSSDDDLSPSVVLGGDNNKDDDSFEPFYVSAILQQDPTALEKLYKTISYLDEHGEPPLFREKARHDDGCWLFLGTNPPSTTLCNDNSSDGDATTKKRKRNNGTATTTALAGRAEHVDEVTHSGTWHTQILGTKTWLIRPNKNAQDWQQHQDDNDDDDDATPQVPNIQNLQNAERAEKNRAWRLRICVEAGDLFVLNTRAWYHRTEIEEGVGYSVSVARDFFLETTNKKEKTSAELIADRNVAKGDIVLDEDDLPDDFPRSDDPNCSLAEIANDEDDDDDDECESRIVLVALRDVKKGETLTIASGENHDDDEEEDDDNSDLENDEKMNAADGIDPRAIAKSNYNTGEIVLESDDIPEDLPCSTSPNCELIEENDVVKLRALRVILVGDILTLEPDENEEYVEADVNLDTHEFIKL